MPRIPLGAGVRFGDPYIEVFGPDGITPMDATNPVITLRRPYLAGVPQADKTYGIGTGLVRDDIGQYHGEAPRSDVAVLGHYAWIMTADDPQDVLAGKAFDVVDPFAPALLTLGDARSALGKTGRNVDVDELQLHVDTVNERIETMTGPAVPRTVTDTGTTEWTAPRHGWEHESRHSGRIRLTAPPGPGPGSFLTLTAATLAGQPVDLTQWQTTGGTVTPVRGFTIPAYALYSVTYRVGRDPIPAPLFLAARILLQHLWQPQRAQTSGVAGDPLDVTSTGYGFAIPNRVAELVRPYEFGPGIA